MTRHSTRKRRKVLRAVLSAFTREERKAFRELIRHLKEVPK